MQGAEPGAGVEGGAGFGGKAALTGSVPWRAKLGAFGVHGSVLRHTEPFRALAAERLARIARASRTPRTYAHDPGRFAIIALYGRFGYALLAVSTSDGHIEEVVAKEISAR